MPLKENTKPGSPGFGENIATEIKAGKPPKQAEAIAYAKVRGDVDAKLDTLKARCDALEPSPHGRISAAQQKHELGLDARIDALCARKDSARMFPSYTLAQLKATVAKGVTETTPKETLEKIKTEIAARESGESKTKATPQVPWK